MGKTKTFNKIIPAILVFSVFSAGFLISSSDALAKKNNPPKKNENKKPKIDPNTDAGKIKLAMRWANQVTDARQVTQSNPNPPGLSQGIGLSQKYMFTSEYTDLFRYTKFLEKAKTVSITEKERDTRVARTYSIYTKARQEAYSRATLRRAISKKEINQARQQEVTAAGDKYEQAVTAAHDTYINERKAIAEYRKKKAVEIVQWAKNRNRELTRKIRKSSGEARARLVAERKKILSERFAAHAKNVFRYQIKLAASTASRNSKLAAAGDVLTADVQSIENNMAKKSDEDSSYINVRTGVEVSLATTWRTRALTAIARTPGK